MKQNTKKNTKLFLKSKEFQLKQEMFLLNYYNEHQQIVNLIMLRTKTFNLKFKVEVEIS